VLFHEFLGGLAIARRRADKLECGSVSGDIDFQLAQLVGPRQADEQNGAEHGEDAKS